MDSSTPAVWKGHDKWSKEERGKERAQRMYEKCLGELRHVAWDTRFADPAAAGTAVLVVLDTNS